VNVSFNICSRFCCSFEAVPSMKVFQKVIVLEVFLGIVKQVCRIIVNKCGKACLLFFFSSPHCVVLGNNFQQNVLSLLNDNSASSV